MNNNLCKQVLLGGGSITPLLIPSDETGGTGLTNPSIFIDGNILILNLRHVNYTLYHAEEEQRFNHRWGCLVYLHPENDQHLKTQNYFCYLDNELNIDKYFKIEMLPSEQEPMWQFHGLEDARIIKWNGTFYICGVRRDTTPNGQGRIELSELYVFDDKVKEVGRYRIEPPKENSYCEKNWMPVLDMPFHFIKWSNPTELVEVDINNGKSKTVFLESKVIKDIADFRGGSQVIWYKDRRIAITHQVNLFNNPLRQKDGRYYQCIISWDKDWKLISYSEPFSFMTNEIEFSCGMALYQNDLLITFGVTDNAAFILRVPEKMIDSLL